MQQATAWHSAAGVTMGQVDCFPTQVVAMAGTCNQMGFLPTLRLWTCAFATASHALCPVPSCRKLRRQLKLAKPGRSRSDAKLTWLQASPRSVSSLLPLFHLPPGALESCALGSRVGSPASCGPHRLESGPLTSL